jgi:DNA-binding HxlR family transcriptional regulator
MSESGLSAPHVCSSARGCLVTTSGHSQPAGVARSRLDDFLTYWIYIVMTETMATSRSMNDVHECTRCAVAATSEVMGAKWTSLILHDLSEGPRRFTQLEHACPGISPRTLSERLHTLEGQGIVVRQSYPESPPRVEYGLTDKGVALLPIIDEMRNFGHAWLIADDHHDHQHEHVLAQDELRRPAS